jgi:uncharacterized protein YyaL (SSP411 family)
MSSTHSSREPNRLAGESSPYLRLHQFNPVDWYPWGPEALERAKAEDRPIFLSVGYSTCYWCHVMERESFSDAGIAELMNESFVNIKIDREERPELDEIYMVATQVIAGQGGWPNSLFLTPDLEPYYAGTYFPPADAHGRPGFPTVLRSMRDAWHERRSDVIEQAQSVAGAIRHYLEERSQPAAAVPGPQVAEAALLDLQRRFDQTWGGFGGAPKFPTPSNLLLLLELSPEHRPARDMLATTLDQMARGGIYDHLGGGFHRYATDREWKVPHFEKMLYDNAWLLEVYARYHALTGDAEAARVVRGTAEFLGRQLTGPEGALWSALDAETDGHEGAFYVWTRDELTAALGEEDAIFLAPLYGFDGPPFFEGDRYVLHLPARLANQAARRQVTVEALLTEIEPLRGQLLAERSQRPALATDDKVLADWNGMAINGLAVAGRLLAEPDFIDRAATAARFILGTLRGPEGVLLHAWRDGQGKVPALLNDYACMVRGLLALHEATAAEEWLTAAIALTEEQIARLADEAEGGFFVAAASADVLVRSKEIFDGATPSANALAIDNLIRLGEITGDERWRRRAEAGLRAFGQVAEQHATGTPMLAVALRRYHRSLQPRDEIVQPSLDVAVDDSGAGTFELSLEIAPGWHVYAHQPGEKNLYGTRVIATGARLVDVEYPAGESWQPAEGMAVVRVYRGTIEISGRVAAAAAGAELVVEFQACDEGRCLLPARVTLPLESA